MNSGQLKMADNSKTFGTAAKRLDEIYQPFQQPTQTHLFGDKTPKQGEVDLILLDS